MKSKKKIFNLKTIIILLLLVVFVISAYNVFSIIYRNKQADTVYSDLRNWAQEQPDNTENEKKAVDILALQKNIPQLYAWIYAEGTEIDYPVMKAADNQYYLKHLYDGTVNSNGSIFIDYRNNGVLVDDNTVIYGHNMKNGVMFNALSKYKSQDFYNAHPTMMIFTVDGAYLIELICGTIEDGSRDFVRFNFDDFEDMSNYVALFKKKSTFESKVGLQDGDKIVSLCTCTYEKENARYMLIGKAVKIQ